MTMCGNRQVRWRRTWSSLSAFGSVACSCAGLQTCTSLALHNLPNTLAWHRAQLVGAAAAASASANEGWQRSHLAAGDLPAMTDGCPWQNAFSLAAAWTYSSRIEHQLDLYAGVSWQ